MRDLFRSLHAMFDGIPFAILRALELIPVMVVLLRVERPSR